MLRRLHRRPQIIILACGFDAVAFEHTDTLHVYCAQNDNLKIRAQFLPSGGLTRIWYRASNWQLHYNTTYCIARQNSRDMTHDPSKIWLACMKYKLKHYQEWESRIMSVCAHAARQIEKSSLMLTLLQGNAMMVGSRG